MGNLLTGPRNSLFSRDLSTDLKAALRCAAAVADLAYRFADKLLNHRLRKTTNLGMLGNDLAEWTAIALDTCLSVLAYYAGGASQFLQCRNTTLQSIRCWIYRNVRGHLPAGLLEIGGYRPARYAFL